MKKSITKTPLSFIISIGLVLTVWGHSPGTASETRGHSPGTASETRGHSPGTAPETRGHSPEHKRVKTQLQALRKGKDVWRLPDYLAEDFNEVCDRAAKEGKGVLISIGREECGRCQVFYEFLKKGHVKIDPKKFIYVKLCIDDYEHKQYFMSTFEPPNRHLPFVGVIKGERSYCEPCLSGAQTPEAYRKLMADDQTK